MSSRSNTTDPPFHFKAARGSHIWDEQGRRYTDLTSGWNVVNAGWNCSEIRDDWHRHIDNLTYRPAWCIDDCYKWLEAALADLAPGYVMIPSCSGGEGIDNALKIARLVTGRPGVISIAGCYHGSNTGAALAAGHDVSHLEILDLERLRVVIPVPSGDADLPQIERQIRQSEEAGAIVFETVLTNAGCHVVSTEFLSLISRLATELGILLICDEIGKGLNRTGSLLSCQHRDIRPDIIVCGKALTNGLYPLSLCLASQNLVSFLDPEVFASTFAGAPSASAAALATLRYHAEHDLGARTRQTAAELRKRLLENMSGLRFAAGLHGDGLEIALHLNWVHGQSVGATPNGLLRNLRQKGIFATLSPGDCHLMIMPPLNSEVADLLTAADSIADVVSI